MEIHETKAREDYPSVNSCRTSDDFQGGGGGGGGCIVQDAYQKDSKYEHHKSAENQFP